MTDHDGWARFVAGQIVKCPAPAAERRTQWRPGSDRRNAPREACGKGFQEVATGYVWLVRVALPETIGVCGRKKCERCGALLQVRVEVAGEVAA